MLRNAQNFFTFTLRDHTSLNELNQCLDFFESCATKTIKLFDLTQKFYETPEIFMNSIDPNNAVIIFFLFLRNIIN